MIYQDALREAINKLNLSGYTVTRRTGRARMGYFIMDERGFHGRVLTGSQLIRFVRDKEGSHDAQRS